LIRRGQATGALLDENKDRWEAQSILDYWAAYLFRADRTTVDATLDDFDPELAPDLRPEACPYVGLDPFRESTFEVFFGRQRMIQGMLDRLATERLLTVIGNSGSGKSSVVLGGLVPSLKAGALPGSASWHYPPPLVPGLEPLINLVRALSPAGMDVGTTAAQVERLREDPRRLLAMANREEGRPCVLVVDQFEELFTLCEEERERQVFVEGLTALFQSPGLRHTVLLTMRSDYESQVAQLGSFQAPFERANVRVTPLGSTELRDAIVQPAELRGLKFEDGVVDALVREILGEPAGLPLLQFTLLKLWDSREHNRVTWEAYRRLGGARMALAQSADHFYHSLTPQERVTVQRILLRMVRTGERLEVTSNRIQRKDLYRGGEAPDWINPVLGKLVAAHLVRLTPGESPEEDQLEVAHEALVRNWPKLVEWLEKERTEITTRRRLEAKVEEWLRLNKEGGLLDEVQLQEAERWLASSSALTLGYRPELPALVQASREALDEAKRKDEEIRRREIRSSRIFRFLTAVMAVLLILVLGAGWLAISAQHHAQRAKEAAAAAQQAALTADREREQAQRRTAEQQRDLAARQAVRERKLRVQAEAALQEAKTQRDRAKKAVRELQEQKALTEVALVDAENQKKLAEAALVELQEQKRLTDEALKDALDQKTQTALALADVQGQKILADAERKKAEDSLAKYLEEKRLSERAQALNAEAYKDPALVRAANRLLTKPVVLKLGERTRPLRLGSSIGSLQGVAGSLCCVVKDSAGRRYLLSLGSVFAGIPGTPILQPSPVDGGTIQEDKVATVSYVSRDRVNPAVIARLEFNVLVDPRLLGIGRIQGIETTVYPGDKVRLVGRLSGIVEGKVIQVNDREIVTTIIPNPGEIGAPVLAEPGDNDLIGLLSGSNAQQQAVILRIGPILRELGVVLVED